MTTQEVCDLTACPTCRSKVGQQCADPYSGVNLADVIHEARRVEAVRIRANIETEKKMAQLSNATGDCAWCGEKGRAKPIFRYGITWELCPDCQTNQSTQDAMGTEGRRRAKEQVNELMRGPAKRPLEECEQSISCMVCGMSPGEACRMLGPGSTLRNGAHPDRRDAWESEVKKRRSSLALIYPEQEYDLNFVRGLTLVEQKVDCPVCKMSAGVMCRTMSQGRTRSAPHPERIKSYNAGARLQRVEQELMEERGRKRTKYKITEVQSPWMLLPKQGQGIDNMQREINEARDAAQRLGFSPQAFEESIRKLEQAQRDQEQQKAYEQAREVEEERRRRQARFLAKQERELEKSVASEKAEGATIELKPVIGIWSPRIVTGYIIEGMDWPWMLPPNLGDVRMYYTKNERKIWIATIALDKDSPGGLSREFWEKGRGSFVAAVMEGRLYQPVEVAADLRDGRQRLRWFGHVQSITLDEDCCGIIEFVAAPSAIVAIENANRQKNPELRLRKPDRKFNFD